MREGDALVQQVLPQEAVPLPWREVDWRYAGPAALERRLLEEILVPFDLTQAPLWRALWAQVSTEEHILVLTFHHAVVDEWSLRLFFQELEQLYGVGGSEVAAGLPELPVQYADFSAWQRNRLARGDVRERQRAYWTNQLCPPPPALTLPTELSRPPRPSGRGAVYRFQLSEELVRSLRQLARQAGTSLFTLMLATFQVWLHRFTGEEDIVVGAPVSNREPAEVQSLMGCFLNTLPLRTRITGLQSFREILVQVAQTVLGALEHADLPFEEIATLPGIRRQGFQTPVYQVAFVLVEQGMPTCRLGPAHARAEELHTGTSKHDLILNILTESDVWVCDLEYAADLYTADGARWMAAQWAALVSAVAANLDEPTGGLTLPSDSTGPSQLAAVNPLPLPPSEIVELPAVARNANGSLTPGTPYTAPRTELEARLVSIWQDVLSYERVGIHDNFFYDLRGHSLLAVTMVSRIQDELGIVLPLSLLHVYSTVHQLARAIQENRLSFSGDGECSAAEMDTQPAMFFPGWYLDLGIQGSLERHHYVLPFPAFDASREQCRVEFLAETCLQTLRTIQPHGPYFLAGYSFSGLVAYEMARRLRADGEDVTLVALVDCTLAGLSWRAVPALVGKLGRMFRIKFRAQLVLTRGCYYVMDLAECCLRRNFRQALRTIGSHVRRAVDLWRFRRSQGIRGASESGPAPANGAANPLPRELSFSKYVSHLWAYGTYNAKPYAGFVALFVSEELASNQPLAGRGWGRWASGLHEYMIPGDHSSCVTDHRAVLIEKFHECLEDARGESTQEDGQ
ncbi:MAG: condensation domain-containing protein [Pirellulaceae bacterium]